MYVCYGVCMYACMTYAVGAPIHMPCIPIKQTKAFYYKIYREIYIGVYIVCNNNVSKEEIVRFNGGGMVCIGEHTAYGIHCYVHTCIRTYTTIKQ